MAKRKNHSANLRRAVLEVQAYRCAYCQCELTFTNTTLDHIVPRSKGGGRTRENLLAACHTCNHRRGIQDPIQFWERLASHRTWKPKILPNPVLGLALQSAMKRAAE